MERKSIVPVNMWNELQEEQRKKPTVNSVINISGIVS